MRSGRRRSAINDHRHGDERARLEQGRAGPAPGWSVPSDQRRRRKRGRRRRRRRGVGPSRRAGTRSAGGGDGDATRSVSRSSKPPTVFVTCGDSRSIRRPAMPISRLTSARLPRRRPGRRPRRMRRRTAANDDRSGKCGQREQPAVCGELRRTRRRSRPARQRRLVVEAHHRQEPRGNVSVTRDSPTPSSS